MSSGSDIAETLLAIQTSNMVKKYLARGRRYETLSEPELRELNNTTFRAYAETFAPGPEQEAHNDCTSEHELRGLEPDYSELTDELEKMTAMVREVYESTSAEKHDEIEDKLRQEYADHVLKRN